MFKLLIIVLILLSLLPSKDSKPEKNQKSRPWYDISDDDLLEYDMIDDD